MVIKRALSTKRMQFARTALISFCAVSNAYLVRERLNSRYYSCILCNKVKKRVFSTIVLQIARKRISLVLYCKTHLFTRETPQFTKLERYLVRYGHKTGFEHKKAANCVNSVNLVLCSLKRIFSQGTPQFGILQLYLM
jgi:uncharacterized protein (DUF1810 family)